MRRLVAKTFARTVIQAVDGPLQRAGGHPPEIGPLREVLAKEAVRVLVGAALPRGVRGSEVDPHTRVVLDL